MYDRGGVVIDLNANGYPQGKLFGTLFSAAAAYVEKEGAEKEEQPFDFDEVAGLARSRRMGLGFRKDEDAKGKETLNNQPDIRILARAHLENGDSRTGKSGTRHLLNNTKNKAILCPPREKLVMIAMNAALEDVYKKVFADSYQHGASLSRGA
ncbi:hypothetical protein BUALT_BualtMtG0006100 (mitochondrion) [Buddleja alternifolia]|uniref:Uncharacterized protein n=1 Tax=Buddleja alternifolia TaxID=168488 RepID=A0AAV6W3E2_9LAMI|nr:hypothetical protein BUALT_BualtUnG0039200 [Buddleja alternifolia]KAG8363178.1 hypothetical protein BUALT_BualtMtG0006100 [Buddleja alternifolia]